MSIEGPFEWLAGGLFFGKQQKGGIESIDSCGDAVVLLKGIAQSLQEILAQTENNEAPEEPANLLAARLRRLRFLLYDERRVPKETSSRWGNHAPTMVENTLQGLLGPEMNDLIPTLLEHLVVLPFESRKDVAAIFNYLLVSGFDGTDAEIYRRHMIRFRDHVEQHFPRVISAILAGHDPAVHGQKDVCLHYGSMYRACLRHPALYHRMVGTTESVRSYVFPFLDIFVHLPNFEVASDAMESLREVMTAGQGSSSSRDPQIQQELAEIAATFLARDYDEIWNRRFNTNLLSESANYMTRRVALQILSTVLLTRSNYSIMIEFVASKTNLILIMKLLRDTSPHITLDAFHVFKVFVANPNKPPEVVQILRDNQVKLVNYLTSLHQEKEETDTQFRDEKALIIATIQAL
ncbi:calcium binding protein 39 [Fistulifera solaris]|uniref:Calcium binding protein 39 n=1 Tax=Fistulifera solaris TaxID=1519565 RepID=A0A1Z5JKQ5_FISSO|nr:calcium binding protein 39 [Fistulifera solaris]|eukprot:GAX14432.1 calcium binding protein 39 [Fistulifera solaris]